MPDAIKLRRADRPTEGFTTTFLPVHPNRPVRLFLPADYQPKYAYPLVVLLHPHGGDEGTAARFAPQLSRRNYIFACPRASVSLGCGPTGRPDYHWGGTDKQLTRDFLSLVGHLRREYHVHSDRVYVVGLGEGAATAYRLGLVLANRVAGVAALHGQWPAARHLPRRGAACGPRVFIGHGQHNPLVPVVAARRAARQLTAVGADVRFQVYPTTQGVSEDMLRDLNRWIMSGINGESAPHPHPPANG